MHGLDDAKAHVQLYVYRKMYSETQMGPTGICVFWAGDTGGQELHMECVQMVQATVFQIQ